MTDNRVQHYRLLHRLGAGGMGEVYLAEDPRLGRQLALKLLPAEFAQDASRRARFLTEARAAAALNHPNICTVYDAGETAEGRLFIALELLEGETLDVRLKTGPLEVAEVVQIGVQLARALEAAHAKGILHRDLKPANLHLDARGHLKVLDFGLAKRLVPEPGSAEDSTQWQTRTGGILGTPQYMSPEQALGKALDPRTDLFSCGAVLYELLTGRSPFSGQPFAELVEQIVHRPPDAIARFNYAVPPELERVVLKCLQKDPDQRYQSARELAVDLRGVEAQIRGEGLSDQPGPAQVVTWVLLGTNAEELERTVGVQETARILKEFQEAMGQGLRKFSQARQETSTGTTVLMTFARPSNAVQWALEMVAGTPGPLQCRAGLHLGEVAAVTPESGERYGGRLTVCERLLQLARPGQVLMGRAVFDSARQVLPTGSVEGAAELSWVSHGPYLVEGIEGSLEVCEVGAIGRSPLSAPKTSDKAQRQVRPDEEPVLGWRPAVGQAVPNTPWVLEEKLGEGGFGEVWAGRHRKLKERRVFKFCFRTDRVRTLKRELTLFRLLKEHVGDHPNIVRLHEVYLEQPPYYLEEEYVEGKDLGSWCREQGGLDRLPLSLKLELVAQAADALQAAHDSGIIHRDVKPGNILVSGRQTQESGHWAGDAARRTDRGPGTAGPGTRNAAVPPAPISRLPTPPFTVKLTDFGIGQVTSAQVLAGVTRTGFTHTLMGESTSSKTGTHLYMAPELLAGQPASTRSDIYSLGVILYQLLAGDLTRPLTSDWTDEIEDSLLRDDLRRCCARRPEERFAGAAQLAFNVRQHDKRRRELEERRTAERNAQRRQHLARLASAIAALLLILALALGYGLNEAGKQRARAEAGLETARANLYAANVNLAFHAFRENNLGTALDLLNRHVPQPGQRDLRDWEWRYLWRQCQSDELGTLGVHSNFVTALDFSPDGRLLASIARDRTVKVWDLEQRRLLTTLRCDDQQMTIAFSPDGQHLAAGLQGGTGGVRLWDTRTWESAGAFGEGTLVTTMAFSHDGRMLATVNDSSGALWDPSAGRRIGEFTGGDPDEHGNPLDFSRDGRWFAYVDRKEPENACLYALKENRQVATIKGHTANLTSVALSPDASLLATTGWDTTVRVWDCLRRTNVALLTNHTAWVSSLAFSPDGKTLVSAGADQRIRLWSTSDWQEIAALKGHRNEVWALAISPDGSRMASGSKDCSVRLWKLAPPPPSRGISMRPADVVRIFPTTLRGFAIFHQDGTLGFVDPRSALEGRRVETPFPPAEVGDGAIAPDERLVALSLTNNTVCLWDPVSRQEQRRLAPTPEPIERPLFSPDGNLLAGITRSGRRLYVWSVSNGQVVKVLTNELGRLSGFVWPSFAPDGRQLATGHANGEACLWSLDADGGRLRLSGHMGAIYSLAFSPDGKLLATTSDDGTLKLWESATGRGRGTLRGQLLSLHSVTFSPSGRRVVAGTGNGWIKLWDIETQQEVATILGPSGFIGMVVFPQGTDTLLTASSRGLLHALNAPTFAEIAAAENANSGAAGKSP